MRFDCRCCGKYLLSGTALVELDFLKRFDPKLAAWVRSQSEAGHEPTVTTDVLSAVGDSYESYSVSEKQRLLLQWVARHSRHPGDVVRVQPHFDWPVVRAASSEEFSFHLSGAVERNFLRVKEGDGAVLAEMTTLGWQQLDRTASEFVYEDMAFVAMAFSAELDDAWKHGLAVGIERAGYRPHRVDSLPHIERIDQKIIGDIRASRFVVADVTLHRAGVYFEAGYAMALGRPVVWSVRADELEKTHFDTRQFSHIVWSSPADLASQLEGVIAGVVGRRAAKT